MLNFGLSYNDQMQALLDFNSRHRESEVGFIICRNDKNPFFRIVFLIVCVTFRRSTASEASVRSLYEVS